MKKRILGVFLLLTIVGTLVPSISLADENELVNDENIFVEELTEEELAEEKLDMKEDLNNLSDYKDNFSRKISVSRVSGSNRYETSVMASKRTFKSSEYAVIASGERYEDALVGGTLASQIEAPMLLVSKDNISKDILEELRRLNVEKVYLLGGINTVSDNITNAIESNNIKVERLSGKDRIETAEEIEEVRFAHASFIIPGDYYAVIDGNNFADSLAAAPFVGQMSPTTYLYPYMKGSKNNKPYYMAIGGYNSVPKGEQERIRISGKDRFETAVEVAKSYRRRLEIEIETIVLVDGTHYPDALASSSVASMNNGAILLTNPNDLPVTTKNFIESNKSIKEVIIVGGENSVSNKIRREIEDIVR